MSCKPMHHIPKIDCCAKPGKHVAAGLTSSSRGRLWKRCWWCCHLLEDKGAVELAGLGEAAVSAEGEPWPEAAEQGSCVLQHHQCRI